MFTLPYSLWDPSNRFWNQSQCNGWRKQWLHSQATNLHRENVEMWLFLTYQQTTKTKTRCWWLTISTKAPFSLRSYLPEAYIVLVDWQLSINTSQKTSSFLKNLNLLVDQGPKEAAKKYSQYHGMTTSLSTFWVQCSPNHSRYTPQKQREVRRRSKRGAASVCPCPSLLHDYDKYMCGIDYADQNNRYYSVGRKCKCWPPTVFYQWETSINNAFVVYKATQVSKRLTSKEFRMTLATHLMSRYIAHNNIPVGRRINANLEPRLQNVSPHIPVIGPLGVCVVCSVRLSHHYRIEKRPRPARLLLKVISSLEN